jgi:DNA-binding transcriptional regulator YdaS (Cro superfamily)
MNREILMSILNKKYTRKPGGGRSTNKNVIRPKLLQAVTLAGSQSELARLIPIAQPYISRMLYEREVKISDFVAKRIEKLTKGKIKYEELRKTSQKRIENKKSKIKISKKRLKIK